jgi:hypothetical protein
VGIGIQGNIGDGIAFTDKKETLCQVFLHHIKGSVPKRLLLR